MDRNLAIALERYDASVCKRCGTRREDWVDDDGFPLEEPTFVATLVKCYGCDAMGHAERAAPEGEKGLSATMVLPSTVLDPEEEED